MARAGSKVMNHHGSISPDNAAFIAATRSRVVIIPAWAPTHPAPDALKRGPRAHRVFRTARRHQRMIRKLIDAYVENYTGKTSTRPPRAAERA